ncbi:MAG: HAMP domain-containing protein [Holosporales bacterium]|jgi:two-component system osmolarity sensor histidine kinase EnvZ|nr:HAMP domain-containing protein [Holosporales bacterium]
MFVTQFLKKRLPKTLYGRTLLIIVMPIVLIQTISAYVFFNRHLESVIWQTSNLKAREISTVVALFQDLQQSIAEREAARFELKLEILPPQKEMPSHTSGITRQIFNVALKGHLEEAYSLTKAGEYFVVHVFMKDNTLKFSLLKKRFANRTSDVFIMWSLGTSILFTLIAWVFMRNQIRPIKQLAKAADQFGKNNTFDPLKPGGALEVRKAGEAFNNMQERINRHIQQRTEMLTGVSHDLRTPLTRMRLHLELMPGDTNILALKHDLSEMDIMVTHFLEYVQGERLEKAERVALAPVVREVARRYFMPTLQCDFHLDDRIVYSLRPQAFRRLLANLLSNCQRYAHTVLIRLIQNQEDIVLTFEDDGPGIPEEHRKDVFKPFFRLDASRTPGKGGSGLGLPIVKDLVASMGGTITLASSSIGGLGVIIRLPNNC